MDLNVNAQLKFKNIYNRIINKFELKELISYYLLFSSMYQSIVQKFFPVNYFQFNFYEYNKLKNKNFNFIKYN